MFAPLRINDRVAKQVQTALNSTQPDENSCIKTMKPIWCDGRFMLATEFTPVTKCTATLLSLPSHLTKTEMCYKCLCNGNCTDDFMRNVVAKNILPELYNQKQK
jgi:hypothetical protein